MRRLAGKTLPLIILMLFVEHATAEEPAQDNLKPYLLGAGIGCSFTGYREETDSPLNRELDIITFTINGNAEKGSFFHSFNIGFFRGKNEAVVAYPLDAGELEPEYMDQFFEYYRSEDTYSRLYLEYALDYRLWGPRNFPGYLGGALRVDS